ncbi:type II toxin-antitoxin system Phd/YefM family antitoxin [Patescibacteria group bacterium]|nr:type II toxin-antitoxin system Phd/YefM family antitoxin [Patescibacteria group bacterium]MCG2695017.1 type II toxin-antitoxin system Phd/YefM family antitoxin [Candidatus Parcubacteria bacterium]
MVTTMPITKARINLGAVVKRVSLNKERIILEKDGFPVAVIVDLETFEDIVDSVDLEKAVGTSKREFISIENAMKKYAL